MVGVLHDVLLRHSSAVWESLPGMDSFFQLGSLPVDRGRRGIERQVISRRGEGKGEGLREDGR
jgi:hypothetical protein